ncbi:hypothetical protein F4859DRAFT_510642 [Xylaria cf. heliscus]|nr:hypothetical protein F4859DRAFT_510642 [Xylaria cf. heliscus]
MSEQARLPSYEELYRVRQPPDHTPEADRIFWTLNGPLHSSISTLTVRVDNLDRWEEEWLDDHGYHTDPPGPKFKEPDAGEGYRYGPLPDYNPDCDEESLSEEQPQHLLECCNTLRPRGTISTIVVKPSPGNELVTTHDYLSTVHPFLLASREDILHIINIWDQGDRPAETGLLVNHDVLNDLMISLEDNDSG